MRVTDYSLLLGVRKGRFCVETQGDGRTTFRPYLPPGTPGSANRAASAQRSIQQSGAPPPLPQGWHAVNSPSGTYYYNVVSRQVTWQPPGDWMGGRR